MSKPDILVFMSDQHSPLFSSYAGGIARTPNLEKLSENGTSFTEAYTTCPLCVPARMSMLLGKMPSSTGIFTNNDAIPERNATFLHALVAAGYETVLIGRMHFVGTNQRHGFTKRFVGDMTPVTWKRPVESLAAERGVFRNCYAEPGCTRVIGGGDSPVLEYDKEVIKAAKEYLSKSYDKPQCIFVSTYGPHFPYVAPQDLYTHYKEIADVPDNFDNVLYKLNPVLSSKVINVSHETVKKARAAYYGMIETIDSQIGEIRAVYNKFLDAHQRQGFFAYLSDHGDQAGDRKMFGKMTFFENSAKIPLIFEGPGIAKGHRVQMPSTIMDLGPTLCELAQAVIQPAQCGTSLVPQLHQQKEREDRAIISEVLDPFGGHPVVGRMVRKGSYKYITYHGYEEYDMLFDLVNDPLEACNIASGQPAVVKELRQIALTDWNPEKLLGEHQTHLEHMALIETWEAAAGVVIPDRWNRNPDFAKGMPVVE